MKELLYTILELEAWNNRGTCYFCYGNKAVCQIRVRSKKTDRIIQNSKACENCRDKLSELPKCDNCGRLKTKSRFHSGEYICDCVKYKEDAKELPVLPHERRPNAFYEKQINELREKERELVEEVDTHLEALEISEVWNKRQKQELLDEINRLKTEVERLKNQTPQELINELNSCKEKIKVLESQLEQLASQQTAQIEVKEAKKQYSWLRLKK